MKVFRSMISGLTALLMLAAAVPVSAVTAEGELPLIVPISGEASDYGYAPMTGISPESRRLRLGDVQDVPASFDLREQGVITPVRSQGRTSTCWAHAALACVESNMVLQGMADATLDLSESHMAWFGYGSAVTDPEDPLYGDGGSLGTDVYASGGNAALATSILARWSGVQLEENAPAISEMAQVPEEQRYVSYAHIRESLWLDAADHGAMKEKLMENGALTAAVYYSSSYYSEEFNSYYQEETDVPNHAVTVVGWDDSFSREHFAVQPPADGAWLCKNSAGSRWGNGGYFYLSYYDAALSDVASYVMTDTQDYGSIYQYDGILYSSIYYETAAICGANIFTARQDERLAAVGFYTTDADVPYTLYIYENVSSSNPTGGNCVAQISGTMEHAGYHILDLDEPVQVSEGTRFSVVISLRSVGTGLACDNYNDTEGRSFYSYGAVRQSTVWRDAVDMGVNVCLKVLTEYGEEIPPTEAETEPSEPETTETEPTEPETTESETSEPETSEPETSEPETTEPETTEPETSEPETTEPETSEPETTEPETSEPETTEPETSEPETTEPETSEPETSEPETTEPETSEPETTEPETDVPPVGDVNGDGVFSLSDIVQLQRYLLGLDVPAGNGDLNGDGRINIFDLVYLKRLCRLVLLKDEA